LGVDPETDPLILIVAWLLKAKSSYKLSKSEWVDGLADLGVTSLDEIKEQVPAWRMEILNEDKFKDFYRFVFGFATDQKAIRGPDAAALWKIILADKYGKLDTWCHFLTEQYKKPVTRDTWNLFYDFVQTVPSDFSTYDPDAGAWPLVIDEFVEYAKKRAL
jgi:DCN1-like protein 1/2